MKYFRLSCIAAVAALLAACGGSEDPSRGDLMDPPNILATLTTP